MLILWLCIYVCICVCPLATAYTAWAIKLKFEPRSQHVIIWKRIFFFFEIFFGDMPLSFFFTSKLYLKSKHLQTLQSVLRHVFHFRPVRYQLLIINKMLTVISINCLRIWLINMMLVLMLWIGQNIDLNTDQGMSSIDLWSENNQMSNSWSLLVFSRC